MVYLQFWIFDNCIIGFLVVVMGLKMWLKHPSHKRLFAYDEMSRNKTASSHIKNLFDHFYKVVKITESNLLFDIWLSKYQKGNDKKINYFVLHQFPTIRIYIFVLLSCVNIDHYRYIFSLDPYVCIYLYRRGNILWWCVTNWKCEQKMLLLSKGATSYG